MQEKSRYGPVRIAGGKNNLHVGTRHAVSLQQYIHHNKHITFTSSLHMPTSLSPYKYRMRLPAEGG
jgi:hypothetical protein